MKRLKYLLALGLMLCLANVGMAQETEMDKLAKPYHPEADAAKDIAVLLQQAKRENKNIVIQAGGNWCIWCLRFNEYIHTNKKVSKVVKDKLLYYHLNYSKENKNEAIFSKYAPEGGKLGYPFFIVLNKDEQVLKVQDSGSLELGKGYDEAKVLAFFNSWTR